MSVGIREDINRIKNVSFRALLSKSAHLKNVRTGKRWVSISPFIFCFIAHPTVRSISCWVLWLDQVFRKLNFTQNSWLEFAADDDWWDNDNFGRGQSWVGAKNKRLVRARQVSSNWDVSQVYAFSFIALISAQHSPTFTFTCLKTKYSVFISFSMQIEALHDSLVCIEFF